MEPHIAEEDFRLYVGEALSVLATLPSGSVDCVITSPPYFGLRDYGTGDAQLGLEPVHDCAGWATGNRCEACYVCKLVAVLAECRRVLAPHGTLWLNLGDSYASSGGHTGQGATSQRDGRSNVASQNRGSYSNIGNGLKAKDLVGIPWRVALALQADGWWLRNDNLWVKPNPMPSSVTDRATVAHEYVFMLTRSARYWYDAEAVKEPAASHGRQNSFRGDTGEKNAAIDPRWHKAPRDRYEDGDGSRAEERIQHDAGAPRGVAAVCPPDRPGGDDVLEGGGFVGGDVAASVVVVGGSAVRAPRVGLEDRLALLDDASAGGAADGADLAGAAREERPADERLRERGEVCAAVGLRCDLPDGAGRAVGVESRPRVEYNLLGEPTTPHDEPKLRWRRAVHA